MTQDQFEASLDYLRETAAPHGPIPGKITVATARVEFNDEPPVWIGFVLGFPPEFCGYSHDKDLLMESLTQRAVDYENAAKRAPKVDAKVIDSAGFIASYFRYVYRQN